MLAFCQIQVLSTDHLHLAVAVYLCGSYLELLNISFQYEDVVLGRLFR